MRTLHMSSVQIQTDTKEIKEQKHQTDAKELTSDENYCGINIANEYHLMEHQVKCCGTLNMFT